MSDTIGMAMVKGGQKLTEVISCDALLQGLFDVDIVEELTVWAELGNDVAGGHVLFLFRPNDTIARSKKLDHV